MCHAVAVFSFSSLALVQSCLSSKHGEHRPREFPPAGRRGNEQAQSITFGSKFHLCPFHRGFSSTLYDETMGLRMSPPWCHYFAICKGSIRPVAAGQHIVQ